MENAPPKKQLPLIKSLIIRGYIKMNQLNPMLKFVQSSSGGYFLFRGDDFQIFELYPPVYKALSKAYTAFKASGSEYMLHQEVHKLKNAFPELDMDILNDILFKYAPIPPLVNEFDDEDFFTYHSRKYNGVYLFPTYICNQNCTYCTYSGNYPRERRHEAISMSGELLDRVIGFIDSHTSDSKKAELVFYGDEPLMNVTAVRRIIGHFSMHSPQKYSFQLVTNGLLLDDDIIRFCIENRVKIQTSLDGPPDIHDRYRVTQDGKPTHSRVIEALQRIKAMDKSFFSEMVGISCTVAPPFDLFRVDSYFQAESIFEGFSGYKGNFSISVMNAQGSNFYTGKDYSDYHSQVIRLKDIYYNDIKSQSLLMSRFLPSAIFEVSFRQMVSKICIKNHKPKGHFPGECIPGAGGAAIGADGNLYVCNTMNLKPIGSVYKGIDPKALHSMRQKHINVRNGKCRTCWFYQFCPVCIAAYKYAEDFENFEDAFDCTTVLEKGEDTLKMFVDLYHDAPHALKSYIRKY